METIRFKVPKNYELVLFGDNQLGNALSYQKGFQETISYIMDKKTKSIRYAIHMGDALESIWITDKRYDPGIHRFDTSEMKKDFINMLKPMAKSGKLITILKGNHEDSLSGPYGNISKEICDALDVEYGGYSCVVEFEDSQGVQFKGYFAHGKRSIRSIADDPLRRWANEKLQLKQQLKGKFGDCVIMAKGHTHRLIIAEPTPQLYLTTEPNIQQHYTHTSSAHSSGYIHPDHRWYVNTGSFLRTFGEGIEGYSERGEYDPVELGYAIVTVKDRSIVSVQKIVI